MSVDIVERLRLNEDDWLFGQTARDARREITALREQVEKLTKERDEYMSGFEAAASKYRNLKSQMQEIINVC